MAFSILVALIFLLFQCQVTQPKKTKRAYTGSYEGEFNRRVAFPIGGIGAGMLCLEGTGALSHVSVRNRMDFFNEPCAFAAVCIKGGTQNTARVLEGPVPDWKVFGRARTGNGAAGTSYGLPRFSDASFAARFPFGTVTLQDLKIPLNVSITGWSPFIPGDADNASLPVGALEYVFFNPSDAEKEIVFSFNTKNFMALERERHTVLPTENGFILWQEGTEGNPEA